MFSKRTNAHPGRLGESVEISSDPGAVEILSAWLQSDGKNTVILKPDTWPDPVAWGLLLADVAHHVADAFATLHGVEPSKVVARVRAGFLAELSAPTDTPTGRVEPKRAQ